MPIDITDKYIRARVRLPGEFDQASFRTVVLSASQGISSVQGKLKGSTSMTIQAYLFDKNIWDLAKVKAWLKKHDLTVKGELDVIEEKYKTENIIGKADILADEPTYKTIKDASGNVIDYTDVKIEGYANTFSIDRGNDMTIPGCFIEHLGEYKENPILLVDHERTTKNAVGRVFSAYEDDKGLKISARISNAPDVRNLRFKIAEKVLRTLSVGGLFHIKYGKDKNYINKIELREISIVTVPMNKHSMFAVKNIQSSESPTPEKTEPDDKDKSDIFVEIDNEKYKLID